MFFLLLNVFLMDAEDPKCVLDKLGLLHSPKFQLSYLKHTITPFPFSFTVLKFCIAFEKLYLKCTFFFSLAKMSKKNSIIIMI